MRIKKYCSKCEIEKEETKFYIKSKETGERHDWCRECWRKNYVTSNNFRAKRDARLLVEKKNKKGEKERLRIKKLRLKEEERFSNKPNTLKVSSSSFMLGVHQSISRILNKKSRGEIVIDCPKNCWKYLPYTQEEFTIHIQRRFVYGMNWGNYGLYWGLDHILPQTSLKFNSYDHPNFLLCWNLKNLRPLKKEENQSKGRRVKELKLE